MTDDRPVFVDPTGRRRRTVRMLAIAGAVTLLGVAGLLVAALLGAPIGPTASLPEEPRKPPAAEPRQQPPGTAPAVTTSSAKPRSGVTPAAADQPTTTTTPTNPAAPTTTTPITSTKGSKPETPPGRPSDRPQPPGHTR